MWGTSKPQQKLHQKLTIAKLEELKCCRHQLCQETP